MLKGFTLHPLRIVRRLSVVLAVFALLLAPLGPIGHAEGPPLSHHAGSAHPDDGVAGPCHGDEAKGAGAHDGAGGAVSCHVVLSSFAVPVSPVLVVPATRSTRFAPAESRLVSGLDLPPLLGPPRT